MAVTLTSRLGLPISSSGSDPRQNTRAKFNDLMSLLEDKVAIDMQGLASARPVAGIRGRYYYATDTGVLSRDSGTAWAQVLTQPTSGSLTLSPSAGITIVNASWVAHTPSLKSVKMAFSHADGFTIGATGRIQVPLCAALPADLRPASGIVVASALSSAIPQRPTLDVALGSGGVVLAIGGPANTSIAPNQVLSATLLVPTA